jgi:hypothetical protein
MCITRVANEDGFCEGNLRQTATNRRLRENLRYVYDRIVDTHLRENLGEYSEDSLLLHWTKYCMNNGCEMYLCIYV